MPRKSKISLPRYLKLREHPSTGQIRPRWELGGRGGKELRKAGFHSMDLKDEAGDWLTLGSAMEAAKVLNHQVDLWRAGEAADALEAAALAGQKQIGTRLGQTPTREVRRGSHQLLVDDVLKEYLGREAFKSLAPSSQRLYQVYGEIFSIWLGDIGFRSVRVRDAEKLFSRLLDVGFYGAARRSAGAETGGRRKSWHENFLNLPDAQKDQIRMERQDEYGRFPTDMPGYTMAYDTFRFGSRLWEWALDYYDIRDRNPFSKRGITAPGGRKVLVTPEQMAAIWQAGIEINRPEAGMLWALGIHTCQRKSDLTDITWRLQTEGRYELTQKKTGKRVEFECTNLLHRILEEYRDHLQARGFTPHPDMPIIISSRNGRPFSHINTASDIAREARDRAAEDNPALGCQDLVLHDTRATGITRLFMSGNDTVRVCAVSGHSPKQLTTIWNHYLVMHSDFSRDARVNADAWAEKEGILY
ncbi:MAG: hypothetical protein MRY72_02080 [Aquisalinus sp.]|nr:hypothetical protein [Aquisalinus sp.]